MLAQPRGSNFHSRLHHFMSPTFARNFDQLSGWRNALGRTLGDLADYVADHDLADEPARETLESLGQRLASEKLIVAFVAEFSRGKSELINAIFFADAGKRVLPATPGRTTMCPVELAYDPEEAPSLALLPIMTRLDGLSLGELRGQPRAWTHIELNVKAPDELSEALTEVMRTRWVTQAEARTLGFWDDARPEDNPPLNEHGRVEVPEWRHALINYPHPLLKQGLVVLDTPGLNAIGAEPELTLSLLPTAHATVFILGADTGVTKSDMAIWRDHLGTHNLARFVVLNKIDALVDPLATAEQVAQQIESQRQATARTLEIPAERVFPLSARQALRVVHSRMLKDMLVGLSSDRLREEVGQMQAEMSASLLNLGAKKAFVGLCKRLTGLLDAGQASGNEIRDMLGASFAKLNTEFGFALALPAGPDLERYGNELALIERNYVQYLGLTQALRLSQPKFMEQFRRMLVSKLRVVFENASGELELWSKSASAQIDSQLRERRRGFRRRREALERIQSAAGELEQRIGEIETQDQRLNQFLGRVSEFTSMVRLHSESQPMPLD